MQLELTAKEYLGQLDLIDMKINQDLERLDEMKENAMSTGGFDYSKDRVQTSRLGNRLCSDVIRYTTLDEKINAEIDSFIDAKNQIIGEIRGLNDKKLINVLYKVYVQGKNVKVAAEEMGLSYVHVSRLHKRALELFEEVYTNLHYLT